MRIYATEQPAITAIYNALLTLSRDNERFVVSTTAGNAIVHYFKPASGLSMPYDEVLKMDVGVIFFDALIGESPLAS